MHKHYIHVWTIQGDLLWTHFVSDPIIDAKIFVDSNGLSSIAYITENQLTFGSSQIFTNPSLRTLDLDSTYQFKKLHLTPNNDLYIVGIKKETDDVVVFKFNAISSPHNTEIKSNNFILTGNYLVLNPQDKVVNVINLLTFKSFEFTRKNTLSQLSEGLNNYLVSNNEVYKFEDHVSKEIENLPLNFIHASYCKLKDQCYYVLLHKSNDVIKVYVYNSLSQSLGDFELKTKSTENIKKVYFYMKSNSITTLKLIIQYEDLLVENFEYDKLIWSKEEALASISHSIFADVRTVLNDTKHHKDSNPIHLFTNIQSQIISIFTKIMKFDYQDSFKQMASGNFSFLKDIIRSTRIVSHDFEKVRFGLKKIVIIMTNYGKLFAFDTSTGNIIWSKYMKSFYVKYLFSAYKGGKGNSPEIVVIGESSNNWNLYVINPLNGEIISSKSLSYQVIQSFLVPSDQNERHPIITVDLDKVLRIEYPNNFDSTGLSNLSYYLIDKEGGVITGYGIKEKNNYEFSSNLSWNISVGSPINSVAYADINTQSPGRILGDKSVLYKYLNPNMIIVGTTSVIDTYDSREYVLQLFFIDTVTGRIIYSLNHRGCSGIGDGINPGLSITTSDNWVAYSYWSTKMHRYEISVLELYINNPDWEKKAVSSYEKPVELDVKKQSYFIDGKPNYLTTIKTRLGISSKDLLIGFNDGRILSVTRKYVDPRRPESAPKDYEVAEGLIPYATNIPIIPTSILNYNRTISQLKYINTYPSKLESTTLVLGYGLDLFYSPYSSGNAYDRLNHDFSPFVILFMILGIGLVAIYVKHLAHQNELNQAWK